MQKREMGYLVPEIEVVEVVVEWGFAGSLETPEENPELDW